VATKRAAQEWLNFVSWMTLRIMCTLFKVKTPIHDSIRELITWECKEHGVNIMNVVSESERKCWVLESQFLEA
jgi:hypothetical protein